MKVIPTDIPDVKIIEPRVFGDERGFFMESWNDEAFRGAVEDVSFVQDNHSRSQQGVLRGLHCQTSSPQGKLVRVVRGEVFDVAVDLRKSSEAFGTWVGVTLSDENNRQLWIPEGFAHGFLVLSETADVAYKTTDYYDPAAEMCIVWNDPDLEITWPELSVPLSMSAKDQSGVRFQEAVFF